MSLLEQIIAHGNRGGSPSYKRGENWITCADGEKVSVIAGWGTYCQPRPGDPIEWGGAPEDYPGPYTHVEAWPRGPKPGSWHQYADGAEDTCLATISLAEDCTCSSPSANVPVDMVRAFIELHGGEQAATS